MFYFLSKSLLFLINPICWLLLLNVYALKTKTQKRRKISILLSLIVLIFFSNEFVLKQVSDNWEKDMNSVTELQDTFDYALILTGDLDRVYKPIEMFRKGKIRNLCIIGKQEKTDYKSELLNHGIPSENIFVEDKSKNTYESASHFKAFFQSIDSTPLEKKQIIMTTSAYHIRRSLLCFEKQGISVTPLGTDYFFENKSKLSIVPSSEAIFHWQRIFKEWLGIVVYKMMGYI